MAVTFLLPIGAAMALVPCGLIIFFLLDRFAEPRVSKTLFDERRVFLTFAAGLPAGIVLGLILLAYLAALSPTTGDLGAASLYFLIFVLATAVCRRILVRFKTFGGIAGSDPLLVVHTLSYGAVSGATIGLDLSFEQFSVYPHPSPLEFVILLAISTDLALLETWAGLVFGRAMRKGFSWLPPLSVLLGEGLGLVALSPIFAGETDLGFVTLALLFVGSLWAIWKEEPKALKGLRRSAGIDASASKGRFGRTGAGGTGSPSEAPALPSGSSGPGDGAVPLRSEGPSSPPPGSPPSASPPPAGPLPP